MQLLPQGVILTRAGTHGTCSPGHVCVCVHIHMHNKGRIACCPQLMVYTEMVTPSMLDDLYPAQARQLLLPELVSDLLACLTGL